MNKVLWSGLAGGIIVLGILYWYIFLNDDSSMWTSTPQQTTIETVKDTIDLGTVKYGEKRHAVFRLTNKGEAPLLIRDVRPSCGCTNATWDKHPVKPGKATEISITFEPNSLGRFVKSVDVFCNIPDQVYQFKLLGQVEEK